MTQVTEVSANRKMLVELAKDYKTTAVIMLQKNMLKKNIIRTNG